jgi:hypothetical protein
VKSENSLFFYFFPEDASPCISSVYKSIQDHSHTLKFITINGLWSRNLPKEKARTCTTSALMPGNVEFVSRN